MANIPIKANLDLTNNEIQNAKFQSLSSAPQNPTAGLFYFDTTLNKFGVYNGTTWVYLEEGIDLTAISAIAPILFNQTTGVISANVDTNVGDNPNYLITSGAVQTYVDDAVSGGIQYKGVWQAEGETDYSDIQLPVNAGYMYYVQGHTTIDGINWNTGDRLIIKNAVAEGGTITSNDVEELPGPDQDDIVLLSAAQTLTSKTIDADDNTITDLATSNFKTGVIQTTVRPSSTATDNNLASEQAIAEALETKTGKMTAVNPILNVSGGVCTWQITNTLGTDYVTVQVFEISTGVQVMAEVDIGTGIVTVKFNSTGNIAADTYRVVIIG